MKYFFISININYLYNGINFKCFLKKMLINVEENLIEPARESLTIENQMEEMLESNEGQNIKSDIDLLVQMGFDKKMINKVYILLRPPNIDRAIDFMSEVDGIYQHDFIESTNPKEKLLCFICKKPKQNHLDYIPDDLLNENQNIDIIDNQEENIIMMKIKIVLMNVMFVMMK